MLTDRQGNVLTGATADAVVLFDSAVEAFNLYRGDPIFLLDRAIEAAPRFAMAHLAKAHLYALATEPEAAAGAAAIVAEVSGMPLDDRERSHVAALNRVLRGDWTGAALALDRHSMRYPHDLLALQSGHLMDFFRANARDLRDRIARALPKWPTDMPGYPVVLGMYAFGLEECGDYGRAEETGRQAVALQPLDCWAHHAVAHVLEMQGRAQDGIGWMIAREPHWSGDDNFFKVHNWWHRALYHLDLEQTDAALVLYDGPVRADRSGIAIDLVDASALLWRLHMSGVEIGDRWTEVSEAWEAHADGKLYPFNDWHAVMAHLGADRDMAVDRVLASYRSNQAGGEENGRWAQQIGRPLIEGFAAFWRGDYQGAVDLLHPARFIANGFGGSHAQRDIIDWTLTEAALRADLDDVAEALARERLAMKPHSPVNRRFLARAEGGSVTSSLAA